MFVVLVIIWYIPKFLSIISDFVLETYQTQCPLLTVNRGNIFYTGNSPGDIAYYSCERGMEMYGFTMRKCLEDKKWSGMEPECQGKSNKQSVVHVKNILVKKYF